MYDQAVTSGSDGSKFLEAMPRGEIELGDLLHTIWRGKFWIVLTAIVGLLIGGWYAYFAAVPMYVSAATVVLESQQDQIVDLDSVVSGLAGDQATINTEVEVIRSRQLAGKVVDQLDLVRDPEFNVSLREPMFPSLNELRENITGNEARELDAEQIRDATIKALLMAVRVSNVRQSYVFNITVSTTDAKKSALIANTMAELYIRDQLDVKFEATEQATGWLTERVAELKDELENAEAEVKTFNATTDLISPETLTGLNRQIKELRERRSDAQIAADTAASKFAILKDAQARGNLELMTEVAKDPALTRIYGMVQNEIQGSRADFADNFSRLLDRSALEEARSRTQTIALENSIQQLEEQISSQSVDLVELQQLQREAEASRLIYEYFLGRLKETSVQQGIQQADSRILSRAVVPRNASEPRRAMLLGMSGFFGAIFGVGLVLLRELRKNGVRSAEELERHTGHTVMGQIPLIPIRRRSGVLKYLVDKPNSAAAESIRNLRTSLLLANLDKPAGVIMSTSSLPGEGKTTLSLALAQNLSGLGKKVLLIEGDIRRLVFREYFEIEGSKGLLSVLSGEAQFEDCVVRVDDLGADVLIGERSSTNAADVFSSEKFKHLLETLREKYDAIIVDTPPVLVVPDARVIGQSVDAILYSVKWDSTTRNQIRDGLRMFETVNLKVSGLVLSQIDAKGMKRYGYGDSYGSYAAYGSQYYQS